MTRALQAAALGVLVIWVAVGWALAGELNVHSESFFLLYGFLFLWIFAVPIALSLWVRRRLLAGSRRNKS